MEKLLETKIEGAELPTEPKIDISKLNIYRLDKAIKRIEDARLNLKNTEEEDVLLKAEESFKNIFGYFARRSGERLSKEEIALWEEYESGKGEAFEILEGKKEDKLKTPPTTKKEETLPVEEKQEKKEAEKEVVPEKKGFSAEIKAKIGALKINEETLRAIPGFETIADSEGKILTVLNNLDTVRLKRIESDARSDHEKHVREAESLFGKVGRSFFKKGKITARVNEYGKQDFDFNKHKEDIEGLIHLASVGPEISVSKDEKTREVKLTSEYLGNFEGLDNSKRAEFNEVATAYSNIPQEYAWKKLPKAKQEEYQKIKSEYEKKKGEVFSTLPEKEGMRIMNDVDFNVKMNQTLNAYPDAELQLKKLAESGRFGSTWESIKAQMVDGGASLLGGSVVRLGTKSALVGLTGPLGATILAGAGIGWWRGGVRGRKKLDEEEELLRLGFEDQTTENKKVAKLAKEIEITKHLIASADKDGMSRESKKYSQKKLERLEAEIIEARKTGTDKNLQGADELGNKLSIKIDQLKNLLQLEYKDYVNTPEGKNASPEQFQEKREQWAEKLEVRLEYTKKKLDDGKIIFGKEKDALKNRYDLIQKIAEASAEVALIPHQDEKVFTRTYGNKTRRSHLEKVLLSAEERITENRDEYITRQKIKGALSGGILSGTGFGLTHLAMEHFGSSVAHTIHEQAGNMSHFKGKELDFATVATIKNHLSREYANDLFEHKKFVFDPNNIEHTSKVPSSKPFEYVVQNNTQSRESALIKFYESKGLSHHDAGTKANLEIHKMFHGKDELHNIHKGEHIIITEQEGKPHIEVESHHKEVHLAQPEIKVSPDTHPVLAELQKNPEKFGFKGNVNDHVSVKNWSNKTFAQLAAEDKKFLQTKPEDIKEVYHTVTGKIGVEYHTDLSSLVSHYEVKSPTNILKISENIFSKDTRWASLDNDSKDRVLYEFVVKQIIGSGHEDSYYQSLGITSGNPFDIKPGTLNLNSVAGKGALDNAFASAHDSSLGVAKGFRNKIGGIIRDIKGDDPEDYFESRIDQLLIRK